MTVNSRKNAEWTRIPAKPEKRVGWDFDVVSCYASSLSYIQQEFEKDRRDLFVYPPLLKTEKGIVS